MARRSALLLALAVAMLFCAQAADACISRHRVPIAKGTSPSGWRWKVEGTIGSNGERCGSWLFGMDFNLEGALNWGFGTGVPVGGHLGRGYEISAEDSLELDGSDRVFSGTVNGEATKIVVTLSDNEHLVIHPKLPSSELRRKVVWLRNVRYFVTYYAPRGFVTGVATFNRGGVLLYRDKTFSGF